MANDLLISIGADLSSYNTSLKNAKEAFTNLTAKISKNGGISLGLDLKKYNQQLIDAANSWDTTRAKIKKQTLDLGLKWDDKHLDAITTAVEQTNAKIVKDAENANAKQIESSKERNAKIKADMQKYADEIDDMVTKQNKETNKTIADDSEKARKKELNDLKADIEARSKQAREWAAEKQKINKAVREVTLKREKAALAATTKQTKVAFDTRQKYIQRYMSQFGKLSKEQYEKELAQIRHLSNSRLRAVAKLVDVSKKVKSPWGNIESIRHAAKTTALYGTMAQVLFGLQSALRGVGAEALRFNQSIADIGAILQLQSGDARYLAGRVTDLAVKYGTAVEDIQTATTTLGRAGVSNVDDLSIAMEGLVALSVITGDSMADGANAMASMISVFNDDTQMLVDNMAAIANATRLGLQDFTTISNYALVSAKSLGLTSEAYLALAGSMSKIGLNASTIGTSIRRLTKVTTSSSKDVVNFFTQIGTSQRAFAKALRDDSMQGLTDFSKLMLNLSDADFQKVLPTEVQTRALLTAVREIGKVDGIEAMNKEMKKFKGVIEQAGKSAVGAEKIFKSLSNAISEMFNDEFTDLFTGMFGDNLQEVQDSVHNIAAAVKFLLTSIVSLGIAFTTVFLGGKLIAAFKALKAATWGVKVTLDAASASAKKFGKSNLIMVAIAVVLEAIFYWSTKSADAQEQLAKNLETTTKEFKGMLDTKKQLTILETRESVQVLRDQSAEAKKLLGIYEDQLWRHKSLQFYSEKEMLEAKLLVETNEKKIAQLKTQLKEYTEIVNGVKEVTNETEESTEATRVLDARLKEAQATAAKLAAIANDIKVALQEASLAFDVLTGKLTSTEASAIVLIAGIESDNAKLEEQVELVGMLEDARKDLLKVGNNASLPENFLAIDAEIVKATTAADKSRTEIQLKNNSLLKLGNDENKRGLELITDTNKAIIEKTYLEAKFSTKKEFSILQARKVVALAKEDLASAKRSYDAEGKLQEKQELGVKILDAENALLAANQKLIKAQIPAKGEANSANKEHNRSIRDRIDLMLELAEIAKLMAEIERASTVTLLDRYATNQADIAVQSARTSLAYDAWQYAKNEAKLLKGGAAEDKAKKKAAEAQKKYLGESLGLIKLVNKEALEFAESMRGVGDSFADGLLSGDIVGAFESLFTDIVDVFVQPLKDSFSTLFGNTMEDLVGGFYESMTKSISDWAATAIAETGKVALEGAKTAVVTQGTGDPYTAFARIAAMAALMAAIGFAVGGMGGGSGATAPEPVDDKHATSESLNNGLERLYDVQYPMLELTRSMTGYLQTIANSFTGIETSLLGSGLDLGGDLYQNTSSSGFLYGGTDTSLHSTTVSFDSASISDLMNQDLNAELETIIERVDTTWYGSSSSNYDHYTTSIAAQIAEDLDKAVTSVYESTLDLAQRAGIDVGNLINQEISIGEFDASGMSAAEVTAEIEARFAAEVDRLFGTIFEDFDEYQARGEGMAETVYRVMTNMDQVTYALNLLGQELNPVIGETYNLTEAMLEAAGGIDAFSAGMSSVMENFYTDTEQLVMNLETLDESFNAIEIGELEQSFADLGYSVPSSTAAFKELLEGIDLTDEASAELYGSLIPLAQAFEDTVGAIEDIITALKGIKASYLPTVYATAGGIADATANFTDYNEGEITDMIGSYVDGQIAAANAAAASAAAADQRRIDSANAGIASRNELIAANNELRSAILSMQETVYKSFRGYQNFTPDEYMGTLVDTLANGDYSDVASAFTAYADELYDTSTSKEEFYRGIAEANALVQAVDVPEEQTPLESIAASSMATSASAATIAAINAEAAEMVQALIDQYETLLPENTLEADANMLAVATATLEQMMLDSGLLAITTEATQDALDAMNEQLVEDAETTKWYEIDKANAKIIADVEVNENLDENNTLTRRLTEQNDIIISLQQSLLNTQETLAQNDSVRLAQEEAAV